jgi:hypothetical protein
LKIFLACSERRGILKVEEQQQGAKDMDLYELIKLAKAYEKLDEYSQAALEGTSAWAAQALGEETVPEGWWVHGRYGENDLKLDRVSQLTRSTKTARSYAGESGSIWYVRPGEGAKVLDFSMPDSPDMQRVVERALQDFRRGALGFIEDIEGSLGREATEADVEAAVRSEFAPTSIVESAQAFDDNAWMQWLDEAFGPDFVVTPDGAVAISAENRVEAVRAEDFVNRAARGRMIELRGEAVAAQVLRDEGRARERYARARWTF